LLRTTHTVLLSCPIKSNKKCLYRLFILSVPSQLASGAEGVRPILDPNDITLQGNPAVRLECILSALNRKDLPNCGEGFRLKLVT
jgi:hypothetical protein